MEHVAIAELTCAVSDAGLPTPSAALAMLQALDQKVWV